MKFWITGALICIVISAEIVTLIYLLAVGAYALTKLFAKAGDRIW